MIMEKSIAKENEQSFQKSEPQEVDSLDQTPRRSDEGEGSRCVCIFKYLKNWRKKACESVGFMRQISVGMLYKTIQDVVDGFEGKTGACRDCTLPREDPKSEIIAWIGGHTTIGPVLQVKTTCRLDQCGIEIQMPSTTADG